MGKQGRYTFTTYRGCVAKRAVKAFWMSLRVKLKKRDVRPRDCWAQVISKNSEFRLGLKQAEISRLLGIGEKTYCRWETGAYVQSLAFDRYLRLLIAEPRNVHLLKQMEEGVKSPGRRANRLGNFF